MPPKKQPKPKFRKGVRGGRVAAPKKGKKKASQKQSVIVTVNSTGSGSGGSSMGMPSQAPIFIPTNYQQPIFTPPVDPVKDSLAEKLKTNTKSQGSQVNPIDFPDETPARGKFGSTPAGGHYKFDGTTAGRKTTPLPDLNKTPPFFSPSSGTGMGTNPFEDVRDYGDGLVMKGPELQYRRPPDVWDGRVRPRDPDVSSLSGNEHEFQQIRHAMRGQTRPPTTNPDGAPYYAGRGRKSVARLAWEAANPK
jgi:hypothetical protein